MTTVCGLLLGGLERPGHVLVASVRTSSSVLMVGLVTGVAVILWSRRLLDLRQVGLSYGLGMLAGAVVTGSGSNNAWKFVWAIPVAIVALAACAGIDRPSIEVAVLAALAVVSVTSDSRSYAATFALAALLVVWQLRPSSMGRQRSWVWTTALLGVLAGAVYYLGTTLLVDGYLGAGAQARSIAQIRTSGSLILGGRPELSATVALMRAHIMGFGAGISASPHDILVAKTGLAGIHYAPNNGYVDKYLFGSGVELHSTFGDLWASWGIAGLVFAAVILVLVVRGLAESVADQEASALVLFVSCWTLWNLFFSPLYSAVPTLTLTIGLLLRPPEPLTGSRAADDSPSTSAAS